MRGGVTGGARRRSSTATGASADGLVGTSAFTPGQDGNLVWNTTQPIGDRPILVYVFNGHITEGAAFDYCKSLEVGMLGDKDLKAEVAKLARGFVCEKVCVDDEEFLRPVKGREPLTGYLTETMEKRELRKTGLLFLDSKGKLIAAFDDPKAIKEGTPALIKAMKKAQEENAKRLLPAPAEPKKV